jgi:DNA-binding Xre family transcriptional regulator
MVDDRHRELGAVLSYLVGRQLRAGEIVEALGVSRSAYYLARDEGRLVTADNLIRLGTALSLNPVDLMVRYGLVSENAVLDCARDLEPAGAESRRRGSRLQPRPDVPPV